MDIQLKLTPFVSEQYSMEQKYLKVPVLFSYENRNGYFTHNITDGLPIIGRPHPETKLISYFIGDLCSLEQLSSFTGNLSHGLPSTITFSETEDSINAIEYDPQTEQWKHKTGSKASNYGSTLTMKLSETSLKQFISAFENYRRFAFVNIEGHKRLTEEDLYN
jgi:hypothetical protein